ncbi:3937_t:CDS:2, partial [Paraglomus brasilianum]
DLAYFDRSYGFSQCAQICRRSMTTTHSTKTAAPDFNIVGVAEIFG